MANVATETVNGSGAGETIVAQVRYQADIDTYFIQNIILGNGGNDNLFGFPTSEVVIDGTTYQVSSTVSGGEGNDGITGGTGNDILNGDAGNDTLRGGAGNDRLVGGSGDNRLFGDDGDDILISSSGTDIVLNGGAGDDSLQASGDLSGAFIAGVEHLLIGNGAQVTIKAAQLNAFASVDYNGSQSGAGLGVILTTAGTIGSNFNPTTAYGTITGSAGADRIDLSLSTNGHGWALSAGDDTGGNVLTGGLANDFLISGEGGDTLNGGAGDDTLEGSGGNDLLNGGTGNDILNGGTGNDTLRGGAGSDILNGGAGDDTFKFDAGQAQGDTVVDFSAGDQIEFYGYDGTATFTQLSATQWQVADATHNEVISFINAATIGANDFHFL